MKNKKTKILIADDHPLFRMGLQSLLNSIPELDLLAEVENGEEAIAFLESNTCDLAILDIDMPIKTGIDVAEYIRAHHENTLIIFLTSHTDLQLFNKAVALNVRGFLFKESALEELKECIDAVKAGETYISPVCNEFLEENHEQLNNIREVEEQIALLTPTELKILGLIANQHTTREIAEMLFNSYKTIENHRFNICQKLNIKGSNNLLTFALNSKSYLLKVLEA